MFSKILLAPFRFAGGILLAPFRFVGGILLAPFRFVGGILKIVLFILKAPGRLLGGIFFILRLMSALIVAMVPGASKKMLKQAPNDDEWPDSDPAASEAMDIAE